MFTPFPWVAGSSTRVRGRVNHAIAPQRVERRNRRASQIRHREERDHPIYGHNQAAASLHFINSWISSIRTTLSMPQQIQMDRYGPGVRLDSHFPAISLNLYTGTRVPQ
jgi:hypothetical protein